MLIEPGIKLIDLALFLTRNKVLVISDPHLGYESAQRKKGIAIPSFQLESVTGRLDRIISKAKPRTIVINGDLKHDFGRSSLQEWSDAAKFIRFCQSKAKVILIRGNHDRNIMPLVRGTGLVVKDHLFIDGVHISHGHRLPMDKDFGKSRTIVVGHGHPAITVSSGLRDERYKAFIAGRYRDKSILMMPSFSGASIGRDMMDIAASDEGPFITHIKDKRILAVSDRIYEFGAT